MLASRVEDFCQVLVKTVCRNHLSEFVETETALSLAMTWLAQRRQEKNHIYIIGNGGSAAVASHAQIDFLNVAKLKVHVLHESSTITCMANDYGYENVFSRVLETMLTEKDLLIAISSSGRSENICRAVAMAKKIGSKTMTLSGFKPDNPLRQLGDLNIWLDSTDYGFVEMGHQFVLHHLSDRFGLQMKAEKQFSESVLV